MATQVKMDNNNSSAVGTLLWLLFLVFLVLKLDKVIDWSWWWVTAPLWGPFGIMLILFVLILLFFNGKWEG